MIKHKKQMRADLIGASTRALAPGFYNDMYDVRSTVLAPVTAQLIRVPLQDARTALIVWPARVPCPGPFLHRAQIRYEWSTGSRQGRCPAPHTNVQTSAWRGGGKGRLAAKTARNRCS